MKLRGHDAGFTLLELVAVLAIYSVISVVTIQVLSGALRNQGRAQRAMHDITEGIAILTVLRRDLEMLAPAAALPDGSGSFAVDVQGHLLLLRETAQSGSRSGPERVEWSVDRATNTLWRRMSIPGGASQPPIPMLRGLESWDIRTLTIEGEWVPAETWTPTKIADLPRAVEIRLRTAALGELRMVAAR